MSIIHQQSTLKGLKQKHLKLQQDQNNNPPDKVPSKLAKDM